MPHHHLLPSLEHIKEAAQIVYRAMPPTPQYIWPILNDALGTTAWVKHENHTPTGAFKVRGGLVYLDKLAQEYPEVKHVVSATRGNHGLSIGFAAKRYGVKAHIVVPTCNSVEKNAAMRSLGVDLIVQGDEFQASREYAALLAQKNNWHRIPSMHTDLLLGVASYWLEFFSAQPNLDVVFVPIGQGSGICAAAAVKRALNLKVTIIGVVSAHALAYKKSFDAGYKMESPVSTELADGLACRVPDEAALDIILNTVDNIIAVTDDEVASAIRLLFTATHAVAEGAGAAALAGALQTKSQWQKKNIGLPLCGSNIDATLFSDILSKQNVTHTNQPKAIAPVCE